MENNADRELLAKYAPVLRFSGGEYFLPMNVEDFVSGDTRLYRKIDGKKQPRRVREWDAETDPAKRLKMLGAIDEESAYLRYLSPDPYTVLTRFILTLEIALFLAAAIYSVFGLSSLYPFVSIDYADVIKMMVLGSLVVIWPFLDVNGKAHLGLLLCLFAIFFFGTAFTIGFAGLALAQLAGFWVVYFVFHFWFQPMMKMSRTWGAPLLHGLSLTLIGVANVFIGYLADWFARGRGLLEGSQYQLPSILAASTMLFYSLTLVSNVLRNKYPPDSVRQRETATAFILLFALLTCGVTFWAGFWMDWISLTAMHLAVVFLFGATILWYLLDPIYVTGPGLLREDNSRRTVFGWDRRVLVIITLTLVGYLFMSGLVFRHEFTDINDYLFAAILHYAVSAAIILVALGLLGDSIPGYFLDVMSGLYNIDALRGKKKYRDAVTRRTRGSEAGGPVRYWYYGRVVRENEWTVLQYNYFYAFNDFRSTAGGMNNHEGDWECVNIFLRNDPDSNPRPFGVAYSQHHHGMFEFWEDVFKAKNPEGKDSTHPLVYAALGSHANFSRPEIYPLSMQFSGTTQRLVNRLEEFIQAFRTRSNLVEKHLLEVERAFEYYTDKKKGSLIAQGDKSESGAREFAGGDGIRAGYGFDPSLNIYGDEFKIVLGPPPAVERRESNFDGKPSSKDDFFEDWAFELIDDDTDWIKFKGLWGRKSRVEGEGGPQGPRWANGSNIRIRWGEPGNQLEWLDTLLLDIIQDDTKPARQRKRALQFISESRRVETFDDDFQAE